MFSGIIEKKGHILSLTPTQDNASIELLLETGFPDLELGESIAVNGVCLTVAQHHTTQALFFVSPETLARTSLGMLEKGGTVNLERAVTPSTRLSGHIVQGHVDGTGRLLSIQNEGEAHKITLAIPAHFKRYMVEKGSITLDGISLTLNEVGPIGQAPAKEDEFLISLMIIPHTWQHTTLSDLSKKPSPILNVEVDIIAKYVENLCQYPA
ncbi:riboflavin synthase [Entomobacter blattae]|uniref:Riboflavin synthase n=1 Tax=Entomobacter blattae TaxID=2762277 RepID=A0A7H1NP37_9PROT|nr:riboflavin synthase [Entomobacter blattae]QNT77547.1 Riboflavin synthase [Entomobacter blattae]